MALSGILNIDKPAGWTSFDVVKFIRGRCGEKRVGHAGTLDPAATGVLPVLLGQATRLTEYLMDTTKAYEAVIELGVETETYDADGEVTARTDASQVTRRDVEAVLPRFLGETLQVPPAFSAIKRAGVPMYKRARGGEEIVLDARPVVVYRLELLSFEAPLLSLAIDCGKGFYVRSLAHDIGQALNVGGRLKSLRRTRVGPFRVGEAVPLDTLKEELADRSWQRHVYAPDTVLEHWDAAILGPDNTRRLRQGQAALLDTALPVGKSSPGFCRAYSTDGDFIGITNREAYDRLQPEKIFATG